MGLLSGLFSKSVPKPPAFQSPPPFAEMRDYADEITGTRTVVKNGVRTIERLPRNETMKAFYENGQRLLKQGIDAQMRFAQMYPDQLASIAPVVSTISSVMDDQRQDLAQIMNVPDFSSFVNDYKQMQVKAVDEAYTAETNQNREALVRAGYGNSTSMNEMNNLMAKSRADAMQRVGAESLENATRYREMYTHDMASQMGLRNDMRDRLINNSLRSYDVESGLYDRERALADKQYGINSDLSQRGERMLQYDQEIPMRNNLMQTSLSEQSARNNYQMGSTQMQNQNAMQGYQNQMQAHSARGPSFMSGVADLGGKLTGAYMAGGKSGAWGSLADQFSGKSSGRSIL